MPNKSASISQQRLLGAAYAARTGRLNTSEIEDDEFREKVEKIANSKNFTDDTLHKMASTKHRDEETNKLLPYKIGKGTSEEPERMRKPYKKKTLTESINEAWDQIKKSSVILTLEQYFELHETLSLNPGMNVPGMGSISMPGNPGTSTSFHTQQVGSGDFIVGKKKKEDEDEKDKDKKINNR